MTTVVDEPVKSAGGVGGGKRRGVLRGKRNGKKTAWNLLWQVPLLAVGVIAFGYGVRAMMRTVKPVPFAEQVAGIKSHIASGKYDQAIKEINAQANYYSQRDQLGELEVLSGDAMFLAQQEQPAYVRANYERVNEYYKNAVGFGVKPTAEMNERWGETALKLGDGKLAMEKLEAAIAEQPELLGQHARELVSVYLQVGNLGKAGALVDELLKGKAVDVDDQAWGVAKKIELAMREGAGGGAEKLENAITEARRVFSGIAERDPAGRILLWIGRGELQLGKMDAANKDLQAARAKFVSHNVDDGRAAVLLGRIAESQGDLEGAGKLFDDVVRTQAGTSVWAAGRLGRAEVAATADANADQMAADYRFVIQAVLADAAAPRLDDGAQGAAEMVDAELVRASLIAQYQRHADADKLEAALLFLTMEAELKGHETAASVFRWATTKERLAQEMLEEAKGLGAGTAREQKQAAGIAMQREAAEQYVKHAKLSTMDDVLSANSVWRAAQLFDQAGVTQRSLDTYEEFTVQWPRDARVPEALLAMGRLKQSVGDLDEAIAFYERDRAEAARTPAAYRAAVNEARCYMLKGIPPEENFNKAETALLSLVEGNPDLRPTATEFRDSVIMLGELYYRDGKWADAILRLEEALARYPDDAEIPRVMFLLAQSYRKSGGEIAAALAKDGGIEGKSELMKARQERLEKAAGLFGRVIETLDTDPDLALAGNEPKLSPLEESYLRSSYMQRGECYFELGDYATAIKMYDQAATRFAQHVTAVEAYVQMVNCYLTLKDPLQAQAAAERGQWALKRIPDEEFGKGSLALSRQYYENLLNIGKK